MRLKLLNTLTATVGAVVLSAASAQAHHSYAMFDMTRTLTLVGTVKEFQWTNPHAWIQLEVAKDGKAESWSLEGGSPNNLFRIGWTPKIVSPGEMVTVQYNPLKDGSNGGEIVAITTAAGVVYKASK